MRSQRACEDRTRKFLRCLRLIDSNKKDFGAIKANRVATGRGRLDRLGRRGEFLFLFHPISGEFLFLFHPFSLVFPGSFWVFWTASRRDYIARVSNLSNILADLSLVSVLRGFLFLSLGSSWKVEHGFERSYTTFLH
jgi:hypothetical protein